MDTPMLAATTLKGLSSDEALALIDGGSAFVDLRSVDEYLDVHIPGSLSLQYESGPGLAGRARDCLPLALPLIVLDLGAGDAVGVAAALRGKGFTVAGAIDDGLNRWAAARSLASTETVRSRVAPVGGTILDLGDKGAQRDSADIHIPLERLWENTEDLADEDGIVIAAGYGVRAALAVGILERAGIQKIAFWKGRL
jgi:rhodanese-related sulfurtransferase